MFIKRDIEKALKRYINFPVIALLGPRQSGKTTLVKNYFKNHTFLSFEKPSIRRFAETDPEGFLKEYENDHGIILDEFQYVPEMLSYIQLEVDEKKRPGYFILTGSQNFLANQAITQSLAGRVGILTLLPLSINELKESNLLEDRYQDLILKGFYPRAYTENIEFADLYGSYIHTYVEKDVRQLINVSDLNSFQKFLSLCAGRIGQELNLTEIGGACGMSSPTIKKWLSILESSYIIFLLQPHFVNFNKRITQTPKLYFYDTGLACNLLNLNNIDAVNFGPFKGPLFENMIISDIKKQFLNDGKKAPLYFWRDRNGRLEIDLLIDHNNQITPIEIKSSQTINLSFFDNLTKWSEMAEKSTENNYVIYGGDENQKRKNGHIENWKTSGNLVNKIIS